LIRRPIRLGFDRIGVERIGTNLAPPDVSIHSITRTIT
jgi:hypothetical protein